MALSEAEREAGYRAAPRPSPETTAILRRVAAGWIGVTLTQEGPEYRYDNGEIARITPKAFARMVKERWLLPIRGGSFLENGPPQQYRARKPDDGKLPRIRQ